MPTKPTANKEVNAFAKGIITEASPLNFPEGASFDEANFEINRDGTRKRRLGVDYEDDNAFNGIGNSTSRSDRVSTYVWENAGPQQDKSILVVQVKDALLFFDNNTPNPSNNQLGISKALSYNSVDGDMGDREFSYATINGNLVVSNLHPINTTPTVFVVVTYNGSTFDVREGTIIIRDKFGVEDNLAITTNPSSLEGKHRYNLYNQGWSNGNITGYHNDFAEYPNSAEIDHLGKYTDPSTGKTSFSPDQVQQFDYGTRSAPKGSGIISAFARGEYRINSQLVADPATFDGIDYSTDTIPYYENLAGTDYRKVIRFDSIKNMSDSERFINGASLNLDRDENPYVQSVTSAFGRVWFGGVYRTSVTEGDELTPEYSSTVFFSQTVEKLSDICKCYSENDPTSEEFNDILDTDGGLVNIVEANNIVALKPFGQFLIVFAENGIWTISGGELGFSPTSFQVNKISDAGIEGAKTIVNADEFILFWGRGGIYSISLGQGSFGLEVQNITETTIQTLYNEISPAARFYATGRYISSEKKVKWLYNSDENGDYGDDSVFEMFDRELVLDKSLGAFYTNTFPIFNGDGPYIAGIAEGNESSFREFEENVVTSSNEEILDSNNDTVIIDTTIRGSNIGKTKYLTIIITPIGSINFTFSDLKDSGFKDWRTVNGVGIDSEAYLLTGYFLENDSQRKKAIKYLTTHFNRTETGFVDDGSGNLSAENPSSCTVRVRWDFADHPRSGKFSTEFEAYRLLRPYFPSSGADPFDYGQSVITTKNKIRGSGKAMQLEFRSSPEKDCQLLGWAMSITGERNA